MLLLFYLISFYCVSLPVLKLVICFGFFFVHTSTTEQIQISNSPSYIGNERLSGSDMYILENEDHGTIWYYIRLELCSALDKCVSTLEIQQGEHFLGDPRSLSKPLTGEEEIEVLLIVYTLTKDLLSY